jgi:hypothetical protein
VTTPPLSTGSVAASTPARQHTEPLREVCALALLVGNGVFQLLGVTGLFFVIENWGTDFGLRSAMAFDRFMGPLALGLPMLALLLATHVAPMVRRALVILIVVLVQYGVSAFFGMITFFGGFAYDLRSPRTTLEGLLERVVWLGLLVLVCIVAVRAWIGVRPAVQRPTTYPAIDRPTYGRPYPGQPLIPQPGRLGTATGSPAGEIPMDRINDGGWPIVPPPPMPRPLVIEADPTMRLTTPAQVLGDEETQLVPLPADEPPTQQVRHT